MCDVEILSVITSCRMKLSKLRIIVLRKVHLLSSTLQVYYNSCEGTQYPSNALASRPGKCEVLLEATTATL